jgi:hypothetical protein
MPFWLYDLQSAKGKAYYDLYLTSYELFRLALARKLEARLQGKLSTVDTSSPWNKVTGEISTLANVVAVVKSNNDISKTLKSLGLQAEEIIRLSRMEKSILKETAHNHGMDVRVLQIIVASSCPNIPVMRLLQNLCDTSPGVALDSNTATVIYSLAKSNTPESLRFAIKQAAIHYGSIHREEIVSPHVVDAIVAMTRGSVDRLVEIISNNDTIKKSFGDTSLFFELVKSENVSRIEYEYANDLTNIGEYVCKINRQVMSTLEDIAMNIIPPDSVQNTIKTFGETIRCDPYHVRLIVAVSNSDANALRVEGPGSKNFEKGFNISVDDKELLRQRLAVLLGCAWGTSMFLHKLSSRFNIEPERCIAMAHLISEECGEVSIFNSLFFNQIFNIQC